MPTRLKRPASVSIPGVVSASGAASQLLGNRRCLLVQSLDLPLGPFDASPVRPVIQYQVEKEYAGNS